MSVPVLIVDDEPEMRLALREALVRMGYASESASNPMEALALKGIESFSLVITDMKMPRMDGLEFLKQLRQIVPTVPVVVITGFGTVENAVTAMKEGAADYLMKPFSFTALRKVVERILKGRNDSGMIYRSQVMKDLVDRAVRTARSEATVLIHGESGTGKELLARLIHEASGRSSGPFVAVNCAAIPDNLLESELFGHEKGAFTGAQEKRIGRFETAHGGTILLDEISEMPLALQAKLLRVLQEREIDRVGGLKPVPVDIRVVATTNRDLKKEVEDGRFREDLFYRLNVLPLNVPPLRERREDIDPLVEHFLSRYSGGRDLSISRDAMDQIRNHYWKGNIRELENVMQRACILSDGEVGAEVLGLSEKPVREMTPGTVRDTERALILKTLEETDGNKSQAARILGVSVRTLRNKLKLYDMKSSEGENFSYQAGSGTR